MSGYKSVSIVIPVYNERRTIAKLLAKVAKAETLGLSKEIVVIDDGSTDGTTKILKKLRLRGLKKIFLAINKGKGYALRQGFGQASGDLVIVQDADLEYNPEDYPLLIAPFLAQDVDAVFGSRELNINTHSYPSFFVGGKLVTYVTKLLFGGRLTDVPTGYKAFGAKRLRALPLTCNRFEFCPEVTAQLLKRKATIVEVPIRYKPRTIAQGKKIRFGDGIEALYTLFRVRLGL